MVKRRHRRELYATFETALNRCVLHTFAFDGASFVFILKYQSNLFQSEPTRKTVHSQDDLRGKNAVESTRSVICGRRYSIDIKVQFG